MKKIIKKGKKEGAIIFLHASSSSSSVFNHILNSDEVQQTKIAIDLPGHGNSIEEYKNHEDFTVDFFTEKLIEYINSIEDSILLVGNSLGGHLAIEIANKIHNLKGLLIFGTPPLKKPINFEEAFLPVAALQTFLTENPSNSEIEAAANVAVVNEKCVYTIISDFKNTNSNVRKKVAEDILGNNLANEHEIFTKLQVPKFIIVGDKDPSVNSTYLSQVQKDCEHYCEIIPFENCGHYASLEKPNEFLDAINTISKNVFI
ncbi:alpha/beta hydrolase [Polaribacter haliotis]|uniref:Alpha/beta hydrolase n=1 Tax=Polaribacter haliotis TaxID=1888915 RepID=A0A7L8AHH9_9FLAO|nr:alpha/beta hydrolase [Polaribacter haliotis]QOD61463.1 alpha/beta hydrolase [Polaribacter haliotis]